MTWQWSSTRATASSMDLPSRRRCAARSMKGTGSGRMCWFMEPCRDDGVGKSAGDAARPFAGGGGRGPGGGFEPADGDFEAGHAFVARDPRQIAGADGGEERGQFA